MNIALRSMTEAEFEDWRIRMARHYVEHRGTRPGVDAHAEELSALRGILRQLPDGLSTARMLLLTAVDESGTAIGHAWIALSETSDSTDTAYLHDIEVVEEHRQQGFGRALLTAVEQAVVAAGDSRLQLHVFASNRIAVALYTSNGYNAVEHVMRKELAPSR